MPLAVDETAGDLPVRDVGSRGGLIPALLATDSTRDVRSWRKPQVLKIKDRRHTFHIPREQLEDQCFRLQEENTLLKQHSRAQELKMRRMSTKLMRLQRGRPGTAGARERELDETIQELEARVATLESQKGMLQSKLNLARQHIMDLGGRSHYRPKGRGPGGGGEVRRAAQTAPPRCELSYQEDTHGEIERPSSGTDTQQVRMAELELATHFLRDTLRERDREFEDAMRELRKQQAEGHRMAIKENVDAIRLQKQLSEKGTALLVMQEKFNVLQETYEAQLEESQKSLKESQQVLLHKVEELTEQLKQERLKALTLEGQLTTATLSLQASEELQERVADLEGERDLLKESYDRLLHSTMSTQDEQNKPDRHLEKQSGGHQKKEQMEGDGWSVEQRRLQEQLRAEQEEKERLENERERMRWEKERIMEEQQRDREMSEKLQEKIWSLEQEVLCYQKEVASLQGRLDSVTKEFDMSVEDLSDTLLQIKAFRLKREEQEKLHFPGADGTSEEQFRELASLRASHAETVLELQKTREMLLLQSRINSDFQSELRSLTEKAEKEREENKKRMMEKDKLLERRAQRITTLQAQLKDLAYSPKSYKRTIPIQYTWSGDIQEAAESTEYDTMFGQLQAGESLLEIHLRGASFTPVGLRTMKYGLQDSKHEGVGQEVVTFCTYSLLDFEMHATPLISGPQANYGFTSRYPLSPRDIDRLIGRGGGVRVELHQSLGGVKFTTCGITWIPLSGAVAKRGERVTGRANITGRDEEVVGVLEFWVRLYQPVEPAERQGDRWTNTLPGMRATLTWQDSAKEQMFDFGGGIPNELEVLMERCVGLRARWPGLLPDAYLLYRLYDLPPHATATIHCSSDPVFNDSASYPLAVTRDVLAYLQEGSLWVYVFDDSDDRTPPSYLAKSPIPLRALAMGRHIRGDFVLRDTGGSPRGMVRVSLRWRYPFQAPEALQRLTDVGRDERQMERRTEKSKTLQRPIAKPREGVSLEEEQQAKEEAQEPWRNRLDSDVMESSESRASSGSDVVIIPQPRQSISKGNRLRVEILSLSFHPTSRVALDQSVQRVYVEYRLLDVPMETTETPMSLRKPTAGEEIHYNFTRVIYVDGAEAAPLRQYLYTMLEGTDPNQGRLKFTVVSEPMDEQEEECVDVGYAYLDLRELLLTGTDVIERDIDIVSVGDGVDVEVVGKLKVTLEAAHTLTGIYWEFQSQRDREAEEDREEGEEEGEMQEEDVEPVRADNNNSDDDYRDF
ncbi:protein fantom-like [Scleropages formosus]|uniref:protein fantom-like n=1 Tax=Scleropages formosus TaxID=113540 RepID=UPI0010FAB496|nr:protein fantom-like [Scleropages formosus]